MSDVGNICKCLCGSADQKTLVENTVLIPSTRGCSMCGMELCMQYFEACNEAAAISVHCLNRTGLLPMLSVLSLIVVTFSLIFIALFRRNKCVRGLLGKLRQLWS